MLSIAAVRAVQAALLTGCIFSTIYASSQPVFAANTDVTQVISGNALCSIDDINNGYVQEIIVQPDACQTYVDPDQIAGQTDIGTQAANETAAEAARTTGLQTTEPIGGTDIGRPGNQWIFENTVVEPLASWAGIGNPNTSKVSVVKTSIGISATAGIVVDAILFQFAYTQRAIGGSKRKFKALKSALHAVFRP